MKKTLLSLFEKLKTQNRSLVESDSDLRAAWESFSLEDRAEIYICCAFLINTFQSLEEQHWLQTRNLSEQQPAFENFLKVALQRELKPIFFLESLFRNSGPSDFRRLRKAAQHFQSSIIGLVRKLDAVEFQALVKAAMAQMVDFTRFEKNLEASRSAAENLHEERLLRVLPQERIWPLTRAFPEEGLLPNVLHRAFDGMDEILEINYSKDLGMRNVPNNLERLFEGAGLGVQSSYYTILTAIEQSRPSQGARFVDLGSGYGRVALTAGLVRPDLDVIGYEYVGHRVDVANASAERAGLADKVHFFTQDLSLKDFKIPLAEVYYLYDPFNEETYQHVWRQLQAFGAKHDITIITKGNAGAWFLSAIRGQKWQGPEIHDTGNLNLFRSIPA